MIKVGVIDYFFSPPSHATLYANRLPELSNGEVKVAYAWASDEQLGMRTKEWCEQNGAEECITMEEVIEKSDALIITCTDYVERHETLCSKPLVSGKPVFVEKTFAPNAETARRLFSLAEKSGTPCYSSSTLRTIDGVMEVGKLNIKSIGAWYLGWDVCIIHTLEPIMYLMKARVEKVMALEEEDFRHVILRFEDGRHAYIAGETYNEGRAPYLLRLYDADKNEHLVRFSDDIWRNSLLGIIDFFKTGEEKVPHRDTIEIMAAYDAFVQAVGKPGQWIAVEN